MRTGNSSGAPAHAPQAVASIVVELPHATVVPLVANDPMTFTMTRWAMFPGVRAVSGQVGNWGDELGKSRTIELTDGTSVVETIAALGEGGDFEYHLTQFTGGFKHLTTRVFGHWHFEDLGTDTLIEWGWVFPGKNSVATAVLQLLAPLRQHYARRTLRRLTQQLSAEAR